jgi:hypothetical protein
MGCLSGAGLGPSGSTRQARTMRPASRGAFEAGARQELWCIMAGVRAVVVVCYFVFFDVMWMT